MGGGFLPSDGLLVVLGSAQRQIRSSPLPFFKALISAAVGVAVGPCALGKVAGVPGESASATVQS